MSVLVPRFLGPLEADLEDKYDDEDDFQGVLFGAARNNAFSIRKLHKIRFS